MKRIKSVRQKEGMNYSPPIPLGTNGVLVDMFSKLNLEQELKLGPKHIADVVDEGDGITTITENYATPEEVITAGSSFYRVIITIDDNEIIVDEYTTITTVVTARLYWIEKIGAETENITFIKGKQSTIYEIITDPVQDIVNYKIEEVYINS